MIIIAYPQAVMLIVIILQARKLMLFPEMAMVITAPRQRKPAALVRKMKATVMLYLAMNVLQGITVM